MSNRKSNSNSAKLRNAVEQTSLPRLNNLKIPSAVANANFHLLQKEKIEFIKKIQSEIGEYKNDSQSKLIQNLFKIISRDIYAEERRFIAEIIQNSDDASIGDKHLGIEIHFFKNYILIGHRGKPFDDKDVKSICYAGDSTKLKDKFTTGYKGIGFKSVFAFSNKVFIISGGYQFRFEKQENIPWQIYPIWSTEKDIEDPNIFRSAKDYNVGIIIQINKPKIMQECKKFFSELRTDQTYLLYLKSANVEIRIFEAENEILKINKSSDVGNNKQNALSSDKITISCEFQEEAIDSIEAASLDNNTGLIPEESVNNSNSNNNNINNDDSKKIKKVKNSQANDKEVYDISGTRKIKNHYFIKKYFCNLEDQKDMISQEDLKAILEDEQIPSKLKDFKNIEISFAVKLDAKKDKIIGLEPHEKIIYSYLPTKNNYNFPFLLNTNFLLDAGRGQIKTHVFNKCLFAVLPKYISLFQEDVRKNFYNQYASVLVTNPQIDKEFCEIFNKNLNIQKSLFAQQLCIFTNKTLRKDFKECFIENLSIDNSCFSNNRKTIKNFLVKNKNKSNEDEDIYKENEDNVGSGAGNNINAGKIIFNTQNKKSIIDFLEPLIDNDSKDKITQYVQKFLKKLKGINYLNENRVDISDIDNVLVIAEYYGVKENLKTINFSDILELLCHQEYYIKIYSAGFLFNLLDNLKKTKYLNVIKERKPQIIKNKQGLFVAPNQAFFYESSLECENSEDEGAIKDYNTACFDKEELCGEIYKKFYEKGCLALLERIGVNKHNSSKKIEFVKQEIINNKYNENNSYRYLTIIFHDWRKADKFKRKEYADLLKEKRLHTYNKGFIHPYCVILKESFCKNENFDCYSDWFLNDKYYRCFFEEEEKKCAVFANKRQNTTTNANNCNNNNDDYMSKKNCDENNNASLEAFIKSESVKMEIDDECDNININLINHENENENDNKKNEYSMDEKEKQNEEPLLNRNESDNFFVTNNITDNNDNNNINNSSAVDNIDNKNSIRLKKSRRIIKKFSETDKKLKANSKKSMRKNPRNTGNNEASEAEEIKNKNNISNVNDITEKDYQKLRNKNLSDYKEFFQMLDIWVTPKNYAYLINKDHFFDNPFLDDQFKKLNAKYMEQQYSWAIFVSPYLKEIYIQKDFDKMKNFFHYYIDYINDDFKFTGMGKEYKRQNLLSFEKEKKSNNDEAEESMFECEKDASTLPKYMNYFKWFFEEKGKLVPTTTKLIINVENVLSWNLLDMIKEEVIREIYLNTLDFCATTKIFENLIKAHYSFKESISFQDYMSLLKNLYIKYQELEKENKEIEEELKNLNNSINSLSSKNNIDNSINNLDIVPLLSKASIPYQATTFLDEPENEPNTSISKIKNNNRKKHNKKIHSSKLDKFISSFSNPVNNNNTSFINNSSRPKRMINSEDRQKKELKQKFDKIKKEINEKTGKIKINQSHIHEIKIEYKAILDIIYFSCMIIDKDVLLLDHEENFVKPSELVYEEAKLRNKTKNNTALIPPQGTNFDETGILRNIYINQVIEENSSSIELRDSVNKKKEVDLALYKKNFRSFLQLNNIKISHQLNKNIHYDEKSLKYDLDFQNIFQIFKERFLSRLPLDEKKNLKLEVYYTEELGYIGLKGSITEEIFYQELSDKNYLKLIYLRKYAYKSWNHPTILYKICQSLCSYLGINKLFAESITLFNHYALQNNIREADTFMIDILPDSH